MSIKRVSPSQAAQFRPSSSTQRRPAQQMAGFTGKDFLRILRKRLVLICVVLAFFVSIAIGGTYIWRQFWPGYEAAAMIEVNMSNTSDPFRIGGGRVTSVQGREEKLSTVAGQATTYSILWNAAQRPDIRNTAWAKSFKSDENIVNKLQAMIKATPHPRSFHVIIRMKVSGTNYKDDLADIVNAVAAQLVENSIKIKSHDRETKNNLLNKLLTEEETARRSMSNDLKELRAKNSGDGGVLRSKINILESRKLIVQGEHDKAKQSYELSLAMYNDGTFGDSPIVQDVLARDPNVQRFQANAVEFERRYKLAIAQYPPANRTCIATKAAYEVALTQLNEERQKVAASTTEMVISSQKSDYDNLASELGKLGDELEEVTEKLTKWTEEQGLIDVLKNNIRLANSRITKMEDDLKPYDVYNTATEAGEEEAINPPLKLVDRAQTPKMISSPKWSIMVPLGVVLGLVVAIGLAMLIELANTSVNTPRDLTRRVNLPLLGIIPHIDDVLETVDDVRLACLTNPASLIAESFHQIRTNILYSEHGNTNQCLLVTSPSPSDGRTTVSVNLAATMASGGKKVLLIDANFRQPSIQGLFKRCPQGGLSGALVGDGNWQDLVCEVERGLYVMASGPMPHNPSELLHSEQMTQLLSEMKSMYDYVILDAPPVLVVSDASVLATLADGVILAVRAGNNSHGVFLRAKETLA
ncbi:MAG TPA: polysaccharide biosynthesis tyrosine autokinase, partial [Phycisphaerae bacterium]|nr:polysaccharide biosynthesis tyrosine autokinase [Phycisphaerae bacterium]